MILSFAPQINSLKFSIHNSNFYAWLSSFCSEIRFMIISSFYYVSYEHRLKRGAGIVAMELWSMGNSNQ